MLDDQKNGHPQFRILYTQIETDGQRTHRSFDLQHLDANSRMPEYMLNRHIRLYNRLCKEIDEAGTWLIAKPPVIDAKEAIAANPNWGLF